MVDIESLEGIGLGLDKHKHTPICPFSKTEKPVGQKK
jgi:hypothetical protein